MNFIKKLLLISLIASESYAAIGQPNNPRSVAGVARRTTRLAAETAIVVGTAAVVGGAVIDRKKSTTRQRPQKRLPLRPLPPPIESPVFHRAAQVLHRVRPAIKSVEMSTTSPFSTGRTWFTSKRLRRRSSSPR
jgi:hypothetical protein